jgi:hypothetical protein
MIGSFLAKHLRHTLPKVVLVAAIAGGGGVAALSGIAHASGTSPTTNGCYSTWGSTGANGHCSNPHVTESGKYQVHGNCSFQNSQSSGYIYYGAGSYIPNWGQINCTFQIDNSSVEYEG